MSLASVLTGLSLTLMLLAVYNLRKPPRRLGEYLGEQQEANPLLESLQSTKLLERLPVFGELSRGQLQWTAVAGIGGSFALAIAVGRLWLGPVLAAASLVGGPVVISLTARRRRVKAFLGQLEATLIRMSSALRAGADLKGAMLDLTSSPDPTGAEFRMAERAMALGMPPVRALEEIYKRMRSPEMRLVVVAVRIHAESGGDLAKNLETIASTIRERLITQAQVNAATAEARMEAGLVAIIAMAIPVLVFFFMPNFWAYWGASTVRSVLAAILYLSSAGVYFWLRSLAKVDV